MVRRDLAETLPAALLLVSDAGGSIELLELLMDGKVRLPAHLLRLCPKVRFFLRRKPGISNP